jgi:hypothetical protein
MKGYLASTSDGVGVDVDVTTIRVTRVGPYGVFIGTAHSLATGGMTGVLGVAGPGLASVDSYGHGYGDAGCSSGAGAAMGNTGAVTTTCLRTVNETSGDVYELDTPRALLVVGVDHVVVVGNGTAYDAAGTLLTQGPSIANVYRTSSRSYVAYVAVGNGPSSPEITMEWYTDIQPDPASNHDAVTWLVCGSGILDGKRRALIRRISAVTYMPMYIVAPGTALPPLPYAVIDLTGSGYPPSEYARTEAMSIATPSNDLVVVGVNVYNSGDAETSSGVILWPLRISLVQVLPWNSTAYNSVYTGMVDTTGLSTTCIRVLAPRDCDLYGTGSACDAGDVGVYAVLLVRLDTAVGLPSHALQVNAYTSDTEPQLSFGVAGILTWYASAAGSTRPNDACLAHNLRDVLVTGNSFLAETTSLLEPRHTYTVPGFSELTVHAAAPYTPTAFLLRVACGVVCACVLLSSLDGCAAVRWASGTSILPSVGAALLLGDVTQQLGAPCQLPFLLTAGLQLGKAGVRVTNCNVAASQALPAVALQDHGCGIVTLPQQCGACACSGSCSCSVSMAAMQDACVTTTTLLLPGPIVVGGSAGVPPTPLPGTIRFDAVTQTFQGYTGTAWRTLVMADLPPPT